MDDTREYGLNQGYGSSELVKVSGNSVEEDDDEVEDDEEEELDETNVGDNELNEMTRQNGDNNDDAVDRYDEDENDDNDDGDGDGDDNVDQPRHPKKRKLKSLLLSYEFAPRVPPPTSAPKLSYGGRNTLTDWSEHETFVLLDAWGERFIKCGRKSLRSEEWLEVADRVSQESKMERTDSQCRNRLDTLKKKYKKEKANLNGGKITNTKWVYFKKMDMLLSPGESALKSALKKPSVKLNNTNGVNETRGTSGNSYSHDEDDDDDDNDDLDLLPPKKSKPGGSFKLLADSINKFSEIYEKIENNKIQQMIELEKMKMEFHKNLELQKRQLLDRAQAELTEVRQGDYEDNDVSAENISG